MSEYSQPVSAILNTRHVRERGALLYAAMLCSLLLVGAAQAHSGAAHDAASTVRAAAPAFAQATDRAASPAPGLAGLRPAVTAWLASLPPALRAQAVLPFADDDRTDWHYTPRSRKGVSFKEMNAAQRQAVQAVLKQLLSATGHQKVTNLIELELVLREMEHFGLLRDPARYHLTVYGEPSGEARWGLRFEGHHLSLNLTLAGDRAFADTPSFIGVNPAQVPAGLKAGKAGQRVLANEEDLARNLLQSLSPAQRSQAVFAASTFGDIVTRNAAQVRALDAAGLPVREMNAAQQAQLRALIREYAETFSPAIAAQRMARVEADFANIRFAWAGSVERGRPHYYRIQGARFLVEYDASQDGGNHVHTVWRDFNGDFGRDLLREHYLGRVGEGHGHGSLLGSSLDR